MFYRFTLDFSQLSEKRTSKFGFNKQKNVKYKQTEANRKLRKMIKLQEYSDNIGYKITYLDLLRKLEK